MVARIKRILALLLAFLLVATGSLYLFSNHEEVTGFVMQLISPVVRAVSSAGEGAAPAEYSRIKQVPYRGLPAGQAGAQAPQAEEQTLSDTLPPFVHGHMFSQVPEDCRQVVYILAQGCNANIWLAVRDENGQWRNAMGPVFCTIGPEGLGDSRPDGSGATPIGWHRAGSLYHSQPYSGGYTAVDTAGGGAWITQPQAAGYNTFGNTGEGPALPRLCLEVQSNPDNTPGCGTSIFIAGDEDTAAAAHDGWVFVAQADMERMANMLDPEAGLMVGIFPAVAAGWQIDFGLPQGFVRLSDVAPDILQQVRYATDDNFMGRPMDGYQGYSIILRAEVAEALAAVQQKLAEQGLGLLVYDGYRPARAVEDILAWLENDLPGNKEEYYPDIDKNRLKGVYLAEYSRHRLGIAVDLTLCSLETGQPLDMGTGFDYFSEASWYGSHLISDEQSQNRRLLREAMAAQGFGGYSKEWWHFNYTRFVAKTAAQDFVVPQ